MGKRPIRMRCAAKGQYLESLMLCKDGQYDVAVKNIDWDYTTTLMFLNEEELEEGHYFF